MNEKKILREGWFDKIVSFFKGTSADAQRLANAWLNEQEIEIGHDLEDDFKAQVHTFVENRFERAFKAFSDEEQPERKASRVIVSLLDKRFGPYIDELIDAEMQSSPFAKRRRKF